MPTRPPRARAGARLRARRPPTTFPRAAVATAACALVAAASACTVTTDGTARPQAAAPDTVAGMPITHGPSGPRADAPAPRVQVAGGTSGPLDTIAAGAVEDLGRFWADTFPRDFHRPFTPVARYVSWDSADRHAQGPDFCGGPTAGVANAGFCRSRNEIGWDRGPLMSDLVAEYGDLAPVVVLAHEYGHVVQYQTGVRTTQAPTIVLEQQADCYAGVFMRHVAEGGSQRFTMNTTDGLESALSVLVGIRDSPDAAQFGGSEHGSAFERVTAFQQGFAGSASACADIDAADVDEGRVAVPLEALGAGDPAPRPVDQDALAAVAASFSAMLPDAKLPEPDIADPAGGCARHTSPTTYCAETGAVAADLPGLVAAADGGRQGLSGDFTALSAVASRYALAAADRRSATLTGEQAAQRTACMTGAWSAYLGGGTGGGAADPGRLRLRPGDLDEAVAGLLDGGLIAADVEGATVPSAFARLDAFRDGFTGGVHACRSMYP
ncbi:neutral zinc metallopeptidase [Tomitella fengzijianii]|uniref:Metallopeptidase n=1 Tax=Tomitella fengzijianii TaxID=2597660 RepID=A0A516X3X7_9ACTN|nr:neutral zinc metallopeptidase [Tomitella fengzijianii]QDQ97768.1 metallopeptidase [Tomitella fengzijianii]